jgi:hypothetical protein
MHRIGRSGTARAILTLVVSGCIGGEGSGLIGVNGGNPGGIRTVAPVLAFFVQPNAVNVGQIISPPVQVVARDSLGNTDTTFNGAVTVSLASNSTGGALGGTTTRSAIDGIASFSNLTVDRAGTYTLRASTSGATDVTSGSFSVTTITGP